MIRSGPLQPKECYTFSLQVLKCVCGSIINVSECKCELYKCVCV